MAKKKYLPIKIVEKRKEVDDSLTEGGGGDTPAWMFNIPIKERSDMLLSTLNEVEEELEKRIEINNFIPAAVELRLDDKTTAKSHRSHVRNIIDVNNKNNVIGYFDSQSLLIKIENKKDLKAIEKNATNLRKNMHGLASIVETNLFEPKIEVENNDVLKIKLIDFQDYELNRSVHRSFQERCKALNLDIEGMYYSENLLVYKVPFDQNAMPVLQGFEGLRSIEDMPTYNLSFNSEAEVEEDFDEIRVPEEGKTYPTVGVLDSGVSLNESLAPWLLKEKHSNYIEEDIDSTHGTAVASVILYGDTLEGKNYTESDGCYIFDATIVPKRILLDSVTEYDLIDNISEAIKNNTEIKVWNLCIGWGVEIDQHSISDFGAALDYLQDQYNVVICTSVGNCKNFVINKPKGKIQRSADSVRSLSIGSIAHKRGDDDISEIDEPSPFSRIGTGPFNLVKPELVHYGGNAGIDAAGKRVATGVKTLSQNNKVRAKAGTSFSTPRVTSIVAGLQHELAEEFDPLLIKALTIHSASYPNIPLDNEERIKQLGFGIPSGITQILYNSENEITLVIRDILERGNYIEILDFPYPDDMVEGNYYHGEITVTMVSSPDLDSSQGEEYCQSNVDVYFGTYNEKVPREGRTVRNPIGKDSGSKNLLNPSIYSKREIRKNVNFNGERILKNFHQKYQPVKKWAINLDDLSETNKIRYTEYPKRWF